VAAHQGASVRFRAGDVALWHRLSAESTGATNRRFTTYDRSLNTGLDYAVNRHYDPQQGRFTQVDPIEMDSVELENPQTLNLYAYCTNDPINHTDPSGLGFFSFLKKVLRIVNAVLLTIAAILQPNPYSIAAAVTAWIDVFGSPRLRRIAHLANHFIQSFGVQFRSTRLPGSPPWNPNSRPILGNGFQDPQGIFTCQRPPDCQNDIPPLPSESVTIPITRPWHQRGFLRTLGNFAVGFGEAMTQVPFTDWSFVRWYDLRRGTRDVDDDSNAYWVGSVAGDLGQTAIPVVGALGKLKRVGYAGKLALHTAHHTFGRWGKLSHLQVTIYRQGVKGSHWIKRLPLPFRRIPKKDREIKF
jgi:RHS repeat-associated protein